MTANRRPDPEPLETNDVAAVTLGTSLWVIALVLLLALRVAGAWEHDSWIWVCAAGIFLGLIGVRKVRRRRASRAQG